MKKRKLLNRLAAGFMTLSCCVLLTGCPTPVQIDPAYARSGEYYRDELISEMTRLYGSDFTAEPEREVCISYQAWDGTGKTARFTLDGYDAKREIGYKLVLKRDREAWESSRKAGNMEAPDLNDANRIMAAAVRHGFPVIFLWAYPFQDDTNTGKILENAKRLRQAYVKLTQTPQYQQKAEAGMRSGKWIRAGLEEWARNKFQIDFTATDLPQVTIQHETGTATFMLDGYDAKRKIGYKFVTEEDAARWKAQREQGNIEVPELWYYANIKRNAFSYKFPVLFIYIPIPDYWKETLRDIVYDELDKPMRENPILIDWLKEYQ